MQKKLLTQGGFVCILVILFDQLSKLWMVDHIPPFEARALMPHLNLVLVFNKGVSFGLLNSGTTVQCILLGACWATVFAVVLTQFFKSTTTLSVVCYGAILGGAIGNVIDRFHYGAVVDFIDFYLDHLTLPFYQASPWHWPAFNIADSAIVIGVVLLVFIQLLSSKKTSKTLKKKEKSTRKRH